MSKKAAVSQRYGGYQDQGHLEALNYLKLNQEQWYLNGNLHRDNSPYLHRVINIDQGSRAWHEARGLQYRERHHSQYDVYFGDNNQDPPVDLPVPAAAAVMQPFNADAPVNNIQTKKVTCPTCRKENTITDIDNCHTHSRSGILPADYEEKAAKIKELGMSAPVACCICTEYYADVTLPNCKHDDICHKCVGKLAC